MRVLFSSLPSYGHTYPPIPLATSARPAGHDVRYAMAADLRRVLERFALPTIAAGVPMAQASPIRALARRRPPVGGRPPSSCRRTARVPWAIHGFGRITVGMEEAVLGGLAGVAAELDLELPAPGPEQIPIIDICPPSRLDPAFAATACRVPLRPEGAARPRRPTGPRAVRLRPEGVPDAGDGLRVGRRPAVGSNGSGSVGRPDPGRYRATGDPGGARRVARERRSAGLVPQAAVLDTADVVVHHGGSGTTLGAAATGTPQLLLP